MSSSRILRIFSTLCCSVLLVVSSVNAQTQIAFNESVIGVLTSTPITYTFAGAANQTITLEILSITDDFVPSFLLVEPGGSVVAQGQPADGESSLNETLVLPADGNYLLIVTASTAQLGEFVVRLLTDAPATQAPASQATPASEPVQAVLNGDICREIMNELLVIGFTESCTSIDRNEACYVNDSISIQPDLNFDQRGERVDITDLERMLLEPFSEFGWGVALLRLQANLPDTLPGQNVLIFAFGGINLQANPQVDATAPLQSFYVTGGIGSTDCRGVPTDGILIQTPDGGDPAELIINDVGLEIASTVFIEVNQEDATVPELQINTLEGMVSAQYNGQQRLIPAGQRIDIAIDNDSGRPVGDLQEVIAVDTTRIPQFILDEFGERLTELVTQEPGTQQPVLPETGACVLATFEPIVVNARSGPGSDFGVIGRLDPDRTYSVIGRNEDSSWYQTAQGWSAGFVTRRGGDCSNVPIMYIAPTPTPISTAIPEPIATRPSGIVIDAEQLGFQTAVSGQFVPGVSDSIVLQYTIINVNSRNAFRNVELVITCTSDSVDYYPGNVRLFDGLAPGCDSQPQSFFVPLTPSVQTVTISRPSEGSFPQQGVTLNWEVIFNVVDG